MYLFCIQSLPFPSGVSKHLRGAGNRTRFSRSQSAYTTTVLHPVNWADSAQLVQYVRDALYCQNSQHHVFYEKHSSLLFCFA